MVPCHYHLSISKTEEALALPVWGFFLMLHAGLVLQHIKEGQGAL